MDMDLKLLAEARKRRDEVRKRMRAAQAEFDDLADECHRLDEVVATIESIKTEHDEFSRSASDILS